MPESMHKERRTRLEKILMDFWRSPGAISHLGCTRSAVELLYREYPIERNGSKKDEQHHGQGGSDCSPA